MTDAYYISIIIAGTFLAIVYNIIKLLLKTNADSKEIVAKRAELDAYRAETLRINQNYRRGREIAELDCDDCIRRTCPHNPAPFPFNPNGFDPNDPPQFEPRIEIEAGEVTCEDYEGV